MEYTMTSNVLITPTVSAEDTKKVNAIFKGIEDHLGFVPDGLRLYSISPPILETFVNTIGYFMSHPDLSQDLLAMIRYLVSSKANCSFCIDFNEAILLNLGKTPEQLTAARKDPTNAPLTTDEIVLLQIALAAINNPDGVDSDDIESAKAAGFTERNIFDAVIMASNNKALTHVLRTFKVKQQGAFA